MLNSATRSLMLILGLVHGMIVISFRNATAADNTAAANRDVPRTVLPEAEWKRIEQAVDKGLQFLSKRQQNSGAFQQNDRDEPGISSLCLLACMSRGHLPGEGPYGDKLKRTVNYILESQQSDGLISRQRQAYHACYNHGISSLVITELYGMSPPENEVRHRAVIEKAMEFSSQRYSQPKARPDDAGGWRYLRRHAISDSDLSVTSWNVMFLRSAKNAGFDVDIRLIEEALEYMDRVYDPGRKTFRYEIHTDDPNFNHTRGMAGAGVLSMALAGKHQSDQAQNAAKFILKQPFNQYTRPGTGEQYPCYSAFYCSQAMFQMGGTYWAEFYPVLSKTLVDAQRSDGSWILQQGYDTQFGAEYMTALSILALTPPYQMLPIFQR